MKVEAPNYTQSPNVLFDEVFKTLKEGELRIVLVLIRQTFGWHKEWDQISVGLLADKTGMERKSVQRSLKTLMEKGLVEEKRFGKNGNERLYFRLVMEEMEVEKFDDDPITEEEIEMLSNNSYLRPKVQQPASLDPKTCVFTTHTKETLTKEKKQQHAAVFSDQSKEKNINVFVWPSLNGIDIPINDKVEITGRYDENTVKNAIAWATSPQTKITKGLAPAIKWACQNKPEVPKKAIVTKTVDCAPYNRAYFREISKVSHKNGIKLYSHLTELNEYIQAGNDKIYFKDAGFLEQVANFIRKKSIICQNIFDAITQCKNDLKTQQT